MNLRELEYVVAVADLRSFSQAARKCFVSQPTLSGQIKKLETALGVVLFERTNKKVIPTEVGNKIIDHARHVLHEVNTLKQTAQAASDPFAGCYKLGAFPTLSSYLFPNLVPKLSQLMPQLKLILIEEKTDDLLTKLVGGAIDAAFLALPIENDFLRYKKLFDDPFFLAVSDSHTLAKKQRISQDILSAHSLLLLEEGHCLRDQSLEVCQLLGITEDPDFRATSLETLREMVRANTGITLIPAIAKRDNDTGICYLNFEQPVPTRRIALVWRKTSSRNEIIDVITKQFVS